MRKPEFRRVLVSQSSDNVQLAANIAGARSTFARYTCPAGIRTQLRDGALLQLNLKDANGASIPANSRIFVGYYNPGQPGDTFILEREYAPWARTSVADQSNALKNEQLRISVSVGRRPYLDRQQDYQLILAVESTAVIDWSESTFEIETYQTSDISA